MYVYIYMNVCMYVYIYIHECMYYIVKNAIFDEKAPKFYTYKHCKNTYLPTPRRLGCCSQKDLYKSKS